MARCAGADRHWFHRTGGCAAGEPWAAAAGAAPPSLPEPGGGDRVAGVVRSRDRRRATLSRLSRFLQPAIQAELTASKSLASSVGAAMIFFPPDASDEHVPHLGIAYPRKNWMLQSRCPLRAGDLLVGRSRKGEEYRSLGAIVLSMHHYRYNAPRCARTSGSLIPSTATYRHAIARQKRKKLFSARRRQLDMHKTGLALRALQQVGVLRNLGKSSNRRMKVGYKGIL